MAGIKKCFPSGKNCSILNLASEVLSMLCSYCASPCIWSWHCDRDGAKFLMNDLGASMATLIAFALEEGTATVFYAAVGMLSRIASENLNSRNLPT